MEGWCMDTDGFEGGHFADLIPYVLSTLPLRRSAFLHLNPSNAHKLVLHSLTNTPTKIYIIHIQTNHLDPPERGDKEPPPQHTQPLILLSLTFFARVSNKTKRTVKKKDRKKKKGKKEYRLAFRAPCGPLLSIRDERAAKHQPCSFFPASSSPPPISSVSPGSFVYEESDIMAL